jgi:hypothetical protein
VLVIVPTAVLPPPVPLTLQVTAGFEFPITVAENCCVAPRITLALLGVTSTEMADEPPPVPLPPVPVVLRAIPLEQLEKINAATNAPARAPASRRPAIRCAGVDRQIVARSRVSAPQKFRREPTRLRGAVSISIPQIHLCNACAIREQRAMCLAARGDTCGRTIHLLSYPHAS